MWLKIALQSKTVLFLKHNLFSSYLKSKNDQKIGSNITVLFPENEKTLKIKLFFALTKPKNGNPLFSERRKYIFC